jgi:hypothetical protein
MRKSRGKESLISDVKKAAKRPTSPIATDPDREVRLSLASCEEA